MTSNASAKDVSAAGNAAAVTPSDTDNLTVVSRGIYIGSAGAVRVLTAGGQTVTFSGLAVGTIHPIRAQRVFATGTTANGIVAVW